MKKFIVGIMTFASLSSFAQTLDIPVGFDSVKNFKILVNTDLNWAGDETPTLALDSDCSVTLPYKIKKFPGGIIEIQPSSVSIQAGDTFVVNGGSLKGRNGYGYSRLDNQKYSGKYKLVMNAFREDGAEVVLWCIYSKAPTISSIESTNKMIVNY